MTASLLRAFAPTEPASRLRDEPPGMVRIGASREAYWTGKVAIGLRAGERQDSTRHCTPYGVAMPDPGRDAERVQGWILGGAWSSSPDATEKINTATFVRKCLRAMLRSTR